MKIEIRYIGCSVWGCGEDGLILLYENVYRFF